jgi:hypothetical protein
MRRRWFCGVVLATGLIASACGGSESSDVTLPALGTAGDGSMTQPAATDNGSTGGSGGGSGEVDCAALREPLTTLSITWQVVLGLTNSEVAEWSSVPIGDLPGFGADIEAVRPLASVSDEAAASLDYMAGADAIIERGLQGDASAKSDLAAYLGTDVTAGVMRFAGIGMAFTDAGCEA